MSFQFDDSEQERASGAPASPGIAASAALKLQSVLGVLKTAPGKTPVYFNLTLQTIQDGGGASVRVKAGDKYRVKSTQELFSRLRPLLRPGAVRVTGENTRATKPVVPAWKNRAPAKG